MTESGAKTKNKVLLILTERCKGCGFCVEFCPQHVLSISKEVNARGYYPVYLNDNDKCTKCNLCGLVCPDFAISVVGDKEAQD